MMETVAAEGDGVAVMVLMTVTVAVEGDGVAVMVLMTVTVAVEGDGVAVMVLGATVALEVSVLTTRQSDIVIPEIVALIEVDGSTDAVVE